jgi:hypothetical protein
MLSVRFHLEILKIKKLYLTNFRTSSGELVLIDQHPEFLFCLLIKQTSFKIPGNL